MSKKILYVLIIGLAVILTYNCKSSGGGGNGGGNNGGPVDNPSFSQHIQTIFTNSCATSGCHNATASAGMNLTQGQAYGNIVNVPSTSEPNFMRVLPSDADNSYIIIKLEGRQNVGSKMPLAGSITSSQLQTIKNWINNGAQNN
jgi:hypothetical protein